MVGKPMKPPHEWARISDEMRIAAVVRAIEETAGNVTRAAKRIGLPRSYFGRLLDRYELRPKVIALRLRATGRRGAGRPRIGE